MLHRGRTACVVCSVLVGLCACGGGSNQSLPTPHYQMVLSGNSFAATGAPGFSPPGNDDVQVSVSPQTNPGTNVYGQISYVNDGVLQVLSGIAPGQPLFFPDDITIVFQPPGGITSGVHQERITVTLCFDAACTQPLANSPQTISVAYTILARVPVLSSLNPGARSAGMPGFTLAATGSDFTSQSVLNWNGSARPTTLVSATQLTAQISAADIQQAGLNNVTIAEPDAVSGSNALVFAVDNTNTLSISSVAPRSVVVGSGPMTLTVNGEDFDLSSVVYWNGSTRPTTPLSATQLVAQIPATDLAATGTATITVHSAPSLVSNSASLSITPPSIDAVAEQMNAAHTGVVTFQNLKLPAAATWSVNVGGAPSFALIAQGLVFVIVAQPAGQVLMALSQANGATVWGPVAVPGASGFAYDSGVVYVASTAPSPLSAYDAATGTLDWSVTLPGQQYQYNSGLAAAYGSVYVVGGGEGGTLFAVSEGNGALEWTANLATGTNITPAVTPAAVYLGADCDAYSFRPADGATLWHHSECADGSGATAVVANGVLYQIDGHGGPWYSIQSLDAASGAPLGLLPGDRIPAIGPLVGYFLRQGTLQGVTLSSGVSLWSFTGDGGLATAPVVVNQDVFVGSSSGNLYALDATSGSVLWQTNVGAGFTTTLPSGGQPLSLLAAGDGLLVVPAGSSVTAYTLSANP